MHEHNQSMMATRLYLGFVALLFVATGLWGLLAPASLLSALGAGNPGAAGLTMIRAVAGGLPIGIGALSGWCAASPARVRFGIAATLWLVAPMLVARVAGLLLDGSASAGHLALAIMEIFVVAIGVGILTRRQPRTGPPQ